MSSITGHRKLQKSSRKRLIRYSILFANLVVLIGVVAFVVNAPTGGTVVNNSVVSTSDTTSASGALDQLSSADIAVHVARLANMPEATSVTNRADSAKSLLAVTQADDNVVAKPQVVATSLKSYKDIQTYVTVAGDTIPSIAAKFGVTSDTIRWSNGLQGDNVDAGKSLVISPVNGIVYVVKDGDTIDSLVSKYKANKEQLIADNDAEAAGLKVGSKILIRDGSITPAPVTRYAAASTYGTGFAWGGSGAIYGSNGYDYGYCTWYAANRRAAAGRPIPSNLGDARTWLSLAGQAGFSTGRVPQAGAIIWTPPRDWYGHVGYVESVNADGSVNVSEMNVVGWGRVSSKTLSPEAAAGYSYIY